MRIIAHVSDIHLGERIEKYKDIDPERNLLSVLEDIKRRGIDEVVITGDICSRDSAGFLHGLLESYGFKYSFVLGNHDDVTVFREVFGQGHNYYSFFDEERTYILIDDILYKKRYN